MYDEGMNISTRLCFDADISPSVHLTFVVPVYLVYALGSFDIYINDLSIIYKNSFGENETYVIMDGIYVRSNYLAKFCSWLASYVICLDTGF